MIGAAGLAVLAALAAADAAAPADRPMPVYEFPPVRTTAPRIPPPAPGARTVLDRAWLDRVDPIDLGEALAPVAGLRVVDGGDGVTRSVAMRGLRADRVAVLVDGRPLNVAQGGGVDLQPLDLEGVERVEITRGAVGALYGPDALGGAVNLVRRRERGGEASLRVLGGTDQRLSLRGRTGWAGERWSGDAVLRLETVTPDLDGRRSRSEGGGGRARVAHHPRWANAIETSVAYRRDVRAVPGSIDFPSPEAGREDRYAEAQMAVNGATLPGAPGIWDAGLTGSSTTREYRDPVHPLGAIDDTHRNDRLRADARWRTEGEPGLLDVRAEAVRDRLQSSTDGQVGRDRVGTSITGGRRAGPWAGTATVRWDALSGFSPRGTFRLGVERRLGTGDSGVWTLRAGGGSGFRPPTFDDLFWPARASAAGNPDLRPERAVDLDSGIGFERDDLRLTANAFGSRVRDLIQWVPGADGVWRPHNIGEARLVGAELEGTAHRGGWTADAAVAFLDATDATDDPVTGGNELVGRARWTLFGQLAWTRGAWTLLGGARSVSRVPVTAANTKYLDGYALAHAGVRWQAAAAWRFDLEARNLFDVRYQDLRGYATPGREILLGFRYALLGANP